jgi:hypothetical protein
MGPDEPYRIDPQSKNQSTICFVGKHEWADDDSAVIDLFYNVLITINW